LARRNVMKSTGRESFDLKWGRDYVGSTKMMEGHGMDACFKELKLRHIPVHAMCHDQDAHTIQVVRQYFPDCTERLGICFYITKNYLFKIVDYFTKDI
jgi:hypothetical protein